MSTNVTKAKRKKIYARARQLLGNRERWTQGAWVNSDSDRGDSAEDAWAVGKDSPIELGPNGSCSFCMEGAIYAAAGAEGLDFGQAVLLVEQASNALEGGDIVSQNDESDEDTSFRMITEALAELEQKS